MPDGRPTVMPPPSNISTRSGPPPADVAIMTPLSSIRMFRDSAKLVSKVGLGVGGDVGALLLLLLLGGVVTILVGAAVVLVVVALSPPTASAVGAEIVGERVGASLLLDCVGPVGAELDPGGVGGVGAVVGALEVGDLGVPFVRMVHGPSTFVREQALSRIKSR